MIAKKTILAMSLAAALAMPAPGLAQTYPPTYPPTTGSGGVAAAVILTAMAVALAIIAFSGGNTGGTMSSKGGKTDPYTGRATGPVLMDF